MKKIFIAMMAVAAFAACSTEEQIAAPQGDAIAFGDAFVDNATKAIDGTFANNGTGVNELTQFNVYGIVENTTGAVANIFCAEPVSKSGSVWTYDPNKTQYWVAGNSYSFAAVKNGVVAVDDYDNMPATIAYDVTTQDDVLYAEVNNVNYAGNVQPVKFTFNHLLSKVKFTVKNQMQYGNGNSYKVEEVRIVNAVETATYTVDGTWGESNYERLLIPQVGASLSIKVDVKYYIADKANPGTDVLNDSYTKEVVANLTLEAGKAYNFILTLGNPGEPITFAVENIVDWDEENVIAGEPVGTVAEFAAAIAKGGSYQLTSNLTLSEPLTIAEGTQLNLNLKGNTLTVENSDFINEGTLVMQDGVVSGVNAQSGRRALTNKGNLSLENVTLNQVYTPGGAALINDGASAVATLNDVTIQAENMAISNKNGATMTINGGTYVGNGTGASYSVCNQLGSTLTVNGGSFYGGHGVVASSEASVTTLNAGTYHCTATYTGNSDWVLYANGNGSVVRYDESECTLTHAVKTTGAVNTTEDNGQVVAF